MSAENPSRVAVVAVHGVAYHLPGSSADAVSGLLLGLPEQDGRPLYAPITAETVRIPLHPLVIHEPLKPGKLGLVQEKFEALEERTSYLTRQWRTAEHVEKTDTSAADDFMRLTLQDYRGTSPTRPKDASDATTYNTTRLRTVRLGEEVMGSSGEGTTDGPGEDTGNPPGGGTTPPSGSGKNRDSASKRRANVDVYEMYWADLSRPQGSVLSFFQALYQLLFHFASLSRLAISTGYLENKGMWQWRWLDRMQVYAVRMLTLPIPILSVLLLATVFGAVPRLIPGVNYGNQAPIPSGVGAAVLTLLAYLIFARSRNAWCKPWAWALQPLGWAVLAGLAAWGCVVAFNDTLHIILSVEGLAIGSAILYYVVTWYDDVRDGANETALLLWVAWVLTILFVWICRQADSVQQATLWTMQIVLAALRISWLLLFLVTFAALFLGALAWRAIDRQTETDRCGRAKAAVRTSRFALAMPTLGILIVTLALWSGLFVKTRGEKGDFGNSIAAHVLGNTIKTPLGRAIKAPPGKWDGLFLGEGSIGTYLDQTSAVVTIQTKEVDSPTSVTVTATIKKNDQKGEDQNAKLVVNPPSLAVSPAVVTGGNPASATVTLEQTVGSNNVDVNITTDKTDVVSQQPPPSEHFTSTQRLTPSRSAHTPDSSPVTFLPPNEYFQGVLVWAATPGFPIILFLLLSVFFLLFLWVWPSAYTEIDGNVPVRSKNGPSRRMGKWTSRGLDSTKIATGLAWCAAFAVPFAFAILYGRWRLESYGLVHATTLILEYMGIGVTSAAVLAGLAGSGTAILGIILDVDNYLRTSPADATPRARIMERYVSLLRYLSEYKDPADGEGYARIVIVAHSLGALISADLLRFLKVQSASPKIEVYLFTMGNPLRQLLNRFFPYLYEWVDPLPENSLSPLPCPDHPQPAPLIAGDALPTPNLLGVRGWLNAYRSGDYVGRALWLTEWYNRVDPARAEEDQVYVASDPSQTCNEMCIGAGAHTHYWDPSAPDIAEKLDDLIAS